MDFKKAVRTCLKDKYFDFSGRATRSEFWYFILFLYLLCLLFCVPSILTGLGNSFQLFYLTVGISIIIALLIMVPTYAACVRRLHDTGRSGWWIFLYFIPYIGTIALIIILCFKSDEDNKYGPKPQDEAI